MKKVFAIVLALALVFAMSSTALAADAATDVKFTLDNTQISVTLPVNGITATASSTAVEDVVALTWPNADVTTITNNSSFPIKVDSIQCSDPATGWTLAETAGTDDDTIVATVQAGTGTGTAIPLVAELKPVAATATEWNIGTGAAIQMTFAGSIHHPGAATAALTDTAGTIFTITFTVSAGSH